MLSFSITYTENSISEKKTNIDKNKKMMIKEKKKKKKRKNKSKNIKRIT